MNERYEPSDQEHRDRIKIALGETLFVEASAGTGKTTALVSRVVSLIVEGKATVDQIAAITFTEAAAAELRDRVRQGLEERANDACVTEDVRQRCRTAAGSLERGAFQTIHSFAASLLRERPLEAGLPPGFDTSDEITAQLEFDRHWRDWLERALDSDDAAPGLARYLRMGLPFSVAQLKEVARAFHGNYDLLSVPFRWDAAGAGSDVDAIVSKRSRIEHLLKFAKDPAGDLLANHSRKVVRLCADLQREPGDETIVRTLLTSGKLSFSRGRKSDWLEDPESGDNACTALKATLADMEAARVVFLTGRTRSAILGLLEELRQFVLDYEQRRKEEGRAEFHDLLVWAQELLKSSKEARDHFLARYRYVLIDEFQDTDPIQSEIALELTDGGRDGRLFIVGDPKQSIYRFRRADIESVKEMRDRLDAGLVPLAQNFRCQEPIVDWVNSVFGRWMGREARPVQAQYQDLLARWTPAECETPMGVHWYGEECDNALEMRLREAQATAGVLLQIKSEAWQIRDSNSGLREAQYRDVCILMPTRSGLRELEDQLSGRDIPYRVESQSTVLDSQDVRELLSCLRAIDSPADEVAIVAALRSSAFSCSDVDLLRHVDAGGKFSYAGKSSNGGPVSEGLAVLARYHKNRMWQPPDQLIEEFVRERRMVELSFDRMRPRERWRRLRFVIERARTFAATAGGGLREYLDWIERQAAEEARIMVEAPVPETDEDAVRIMTVHAAKGLEFPIVVLIGLGRSGGGRAGPVIFHRATCTAEVSLGSSRVLPLQTEGYSEAKDAEAAADEAERVRLLYVAATRARDHLVVSTFRNSNRTGSPAHKIVELTDVISHLWREMPVFDGRASLQQFEDSEVDVSVPTQSDRDRWLEDREEVVRRASSKHAVAASSLARAPDYDDLDRETPPGRRGRAGTNVGRAVHAVLQAVDLPHGRNVSGLSRFHAESEGVSDRTEEVERLAKRAIHSDVVRRAVESTRYYREIYAATPIGERVLEGFVDLCFVEDGALVIVDFKTDAIANEDAESAAHKYRTQVGAYSLALASSTGMPVKEAVLLFLQRDPMPEVFTDIEALMTEAEEAALAVSRGAQLVG